MTLSVKIQTFMASQVGKVVPKQRISFTRRKTNSRQIGLPSGCLLFACPLIKLVHWTDELMRKASGTWAIRLFTCRRGGDTLKAAVDSLRNRSYLLPSKVLQKFTRRGATRTSRLRGGSATGAEPRFDSKTLAALGAEPRGRGRFRYSRVTRGRLQRQRRRVWR
jgi:hypothetical protein